MYVCVCVYDTEILNFLQRTNETRQNCIISANLVPETHYKISNQGSSCTGEPSNCEYGTLLQSFHRGTLSIYWHIAQIF